MSLTALPSVTVSPKQRLAVLFEELAELAGQRNAIDGRIVEIVAEVDRDELCGMTGARSVAALVAWKTGSSSANAHTIAAADLGYMLKKPFEWHVLAAQDVPVADLSALHGKSQAGRDVAHIDEIHDEIEELACC